MTSYKIITDFAHVRTYLAIDINNMVRSHTLVDAEQDHVDIEEDGSHNNEYIEIRT